MKYRPQRFSEVIGQPMAVRLLKAVAKEPDRAQRSIILSGAWGTGKTTLARIFGRALVCHNFHKTGDVCLACAGCREWDSVTSRYIEYDSSMVGNVNQIREMKPVFELVTDHYRVIVLDEAHLISRAAQSSMLKVIEEGNPTTFFMMCSTDPALILNTIHSRSLPVEFHKVDAGTIVEHLQKIADSENFKVEKEVLERIAFKSDGHVRDAVVLFQGFMLDGDSEILNLPIDAIMAFFVALRTDTAVNAAAYTRAIMKYPLHTVQRSLNYVMLQIMACSTLGVQNKYTEVAALYKNDIYALFKLISDNWVQGVFTDRYLTSAFFLSLVKLFRGQE